MLNKRTSRRLACAALLGAVLASCQQEPAELENAREAEEIPQAIAAPAPVGTQEQIEARAAGSGSLQDRELSIEQIAGGWRITSSSLEGSTNIGAIAEIHPESASWSFQPEGSQGLDQRCREPVIGLIRSGLDAPPLSKVDQGQSGQPASQPHELLCAGGGDWGGGAGAEFQLVGSDRIIMRWQSEEYLVLERIERDTPEVDMTSNNYLADELR